MVDQSFSATYNVSEDFKAVHAVLDRNCAKLRRLMCISRRRTGSKTGRGITGDSRRTAQYSTVLYHREFSLNCRFLHKLCSFSVVSCPSSSKSERLDREVGPYGTQIPSSKPFFAFAPRPVSCLGNPGLNASERDDTPPRASLRHVSESSQASAEGKTKRQRNWRRYSKKT